MRLYRKNIKGGPGVMKRKVRELLVGFTVIFCAVSMFTGCNLKKKPSLSTNNDAVYFGRPEKQETLTFYFPGDKPNDFNDILKEIEKRADKTLNIKLAFKWIPKDNYLKQIKSDIVSGRAVDAFVLSKGDERFSIDEMVAEGQLLDVGKMLQENSPKIFNSLSKEEKAYATYNEKLIGIPAHLPRSNRTCVVAREDNMKFFNIPDVKSFKDYEEGLAKAGGISIDKNTIDLFSEEAGYIPFTDNFVYKKDDTDMQLIPWEQTPEYEKAVETLEEWKQNGHMNMKGIHRDIDLEKTTAFEQMYSGVSNSIVTTWYDAFINTNFRGYNDPKVKIFPLNTEQVSYKAANTEMIALNKNSKHPDRVLQFLEWIQGSEENYDLFMYGIEGKNYHMVAGKVDFPANLTRIYGWNGSEAFLNIDYCRGTTDEPLDSAEAYKEEVNKYTQYPMNATIDLDKSKIQGVLDARKKSYQNMEVKILHKEMDVEQEIESFINEQKNIGIDQILTSYQKQLGEWKAKQK